MTGHERSLASGLARLGVVDGEGGGEGQALHGRERSLLPSMKCAVSLVSLVRLELLEHS